MNLLTTTNKKMMSSKEIAELTNKTPKNVVRDIRDMLDKLDGSKLIHEQYQ
jgi:phage regulator Rha-like protein